MRLEPKEILLSIEQTTTLISTIRGMYLWCQYHPTNSYSVGRLRALCEALGIIYRKLPDVILEEVKQLCESEK